MHQCHIPRSKTKAGLMEMLLRQVSVWWLECYDYSCMVIYSNSEHDIKKLQGCTLLFVRDGNRRRNALTACGCQLNFRKSVYMHV